MAKTKKLTEGKGLEELKEAVAMARAEIHALSLQLAKGQLKQTTSLRTKKDAIARMLTQIHMMALASEKGETNGK